jgi:aryl-alcohol dehydrogenase-like predicted oxidoreductase
MPTRTVGDVEVGAIGHGMMPLSNPGRPDEDQAFATIHAALDAGVTLFDTADAYALGPEDVGHGEVLLVRALKARGMTAGDVLVATKGGHTRTPGGGWDLDGTPAHLRRAAEASARRLELDAVPLFQLHRPDPNVPWAESVGALRELLDAGTIRMAGVSNANPAQIDEAREIVGPGLVAVQNELSPVFRSSEPEVALCAEHGLAFLPWSPLRGASGGPFAEIAAERGVSPQQVCLAWLLAMDDVVVPIPGSSRPDTIRDSAAAAALELTAEERARLP